MLERLWQLQLMHHTTKLACLKKQCQIWHAQGPCTFWKRLYDRGLGYDRAEAHCCCCCLKRSRICCFPSHCCSSRCCSYRLSCPICNQRSHVGRDQTTHTPSYRVVLHLEILLKTLPKMPSSQDTTNPEPEASHKPQRQCSACLECCPEGRRALLNVQ